MPSLSAACRCLIIIHCTMLWWTLFSLGSGTMTAIQAGTMQHILQQAQWLAMHLEWMVPGDSRLSGSSVMLVLATTHLVPLVAFVVAPVAARLSGRAAAVLDVAACLIMLCNLFIIAYTRYMNDMLNTILVLPTVVVLLKLATTPRIRRASGQLKAKSAML